MRFDPSISDRTFHLAATDYGMSCVGLDLLKTLPLAAPNCRLCIDSWTHQTLAQMESGELSCAFYADDYIPDDFHFRTLFSDSYALVCRAKHPVLRERNLSALDMLRHSSQYAHAAYRYPLHEVFVSDKVYERLGLAVPMYSFESPHFHDVCAGLQQTDLVAIIPLRAAKNWAAIHSLEIVPLDVPKLRFDYRLIWHERTHRDQGMIWLRAHIVNSCGLT